MSIEKTSKSTDVTKVNPFDVIYIDGNEVTDGSIRIIPDTSFGTQAEFQARADGVWNDTGILIAASTVYLGRELQLSAGGEYVLTKDASSDIKSLVPHVRFDASAGTSETLVVPATGPLVSGLIIQPDDSGEVSGSTIQFSTAAAALSLANTLILRTAGSAATGDVTVKLFRDSFTEGLFYQRTYPQSAFPADSDIELTTDGLVELIADQTFYISLECTGTLALKADVTNTTPYFGGNFYLLTEDTVTPDEFGGVVFKITTNRSGGVTVDSNGQVVVATT